MLNLYAEYLTLNPFTFFGVNYTPAVYRSTTIWTKEQRLQLSNALQIARLELEQMLGYYLMPTFTVDEPHLYNGSPIRLDKAFFIALGVSASEDLGTAAPDYDTEPATVLVTTTTPDTIKLYHPSTGAEIYVAERSVNAGVLTLSIPRYALLIDDNNPVLGWDYTDLNKFLTTVSVKNVTISDTSTGLTLLNAKMGLIKSAYTTETKLYIDYLSGLTEQDFHLKNTWIGFAHARMDIQPVEDQVIKLAWLWAKDIPKSMSPAQQTCPFGQFTGAFKAYQFAQSHRLYRASPL